jgi:hypothetical protein
MVSKNVKKTLWGRVYYSTLGVAVSLDATPDATVKAHIGKNTYVVGYGVRAFIKVIKILQKYEELGWEGIPPALKKLIEEYN